MARALMAPHAATAVAASQVQRRAVTTVGLLLPPLLVSSRPSAA